MAPVWSRFGWLRPCTRTDTCPGSGGTKSPPCTVRGWREIARRLKRKASTVSPELRRNSTTSPSAMT
jgi:hypothetical protein